MPLRLFQMQALLLAARSAPSQLIDIAFQHKTTESFNGLQMEIGWIEFASCKEGYNYYTFESHTHSLTYPNGRNMQEMLNISRYAVTVKILPSDDTPVDETAQYAITADICSNPVFALNNGYELSWTLNTTTSLIIDATNESYWIGSNASVLMRNSVDCFELVGQETPRLISNGFFYQACNYGGLHIWKYLDGAECSYNYDQLIGSNITIWIGFDAEKSNICELQTSGEYSLTGYPLLQESTSQTEPRDAEVEYYSSAFTTFQNNEQQERDTADDFASVFPVIAIAVFVFPLIAIAIAVCIYCWFSKRKKVTDGINNMEAFEKEPEEKANVDIDQNVRNHEAMHVDRHQKENECSENEENDTDGQKKCNVDDDEGSDEEDSEDDEELYEAGVQHNDTKGTTATTR